MVEATQIQEVYPTLGFSSTRRMALKAWEAARETRTLGLFSGRGLHHVTFPIADLKGPQGPVIPPANLTICS